MSCRISRDFSFPIRLRRFTARPHLAWLAIAAATMLARVAIFPLVPIPEPTEHDEYSYLLAGDTFAHGRLANPPLPHPDFFESPHVILQPFYASKYPPGQGLVLALGEKLGNPYWGILLTGGLMIFLFCWAADAWLPRHWALLAGAASAILFFPHYWFNSYWGGSLAACGGALIAGALGHLLRGRLTSARFTLALGAAILYATRPYEGAVFCLAALVVLICIFVRFGGKIRFLRIVVLPNAILLAFFAVLALFYNWRVTGRALDLPYLVYFRQYEQAYVLAVLPPVPSRQYRTANMKALYAWEDANYRDLRNASLPRALAMQATFFAVNGVAAQFLSLGLLLFALPWARVGARKKWLLLLFGAGTLSVLPEVLLASHYTAPFTAVESILVIACARTVWYRMAASRIRGIAFLALLLTILPPIVFIYIGYVKKSPPKRDAIVRRLGAVGGRHLVFVQYRPGWNFHSEWVYNCAQLNECPVVFAHDLGLERDRELLPEFRDRTVWLLRVGPTPDIAELEPFKDVPLSAAAVSPSPAVLTSPPARSGPRP